MYTKALQIAQNKIQVRTEQLRTYEDAERLLETIFKDILPQYGYSYREKQLELSQKILCALWRGNIALCEASVGSGKTLAYIVANIIHARFRNVKGAAIISTSTIALQKAITEEYLPQISEILLEHRVLDRPLSFIVRKGKSHYVCDDRLSSYLSAVRNLNEDERLIRQLEKLSHADITKLDLSQYPLTRFVKDCICVQGCCLSRCPQMETCRYQAFLISCYEVEYDFIVANHNIVLAHILGAKEKRRDILPPYRAIVFDEAHKLLEVARQMYAEKWARSEIPKLLENALETRIPNKESREVIKQSKEKLLLHNMRLFDTLYERSKQEASNTGVAVTAGVRSMIELICAELNRVVGLFRFHGDARMRDLMPGIKAGSDALIIRLCSFLNSKSLIFWVEGKRDEVVLNALPDNIPELLYEDLLRGQNPCILTSGTLSVNCDFTRAKKDLGIAYLQQDKVDEISIPSPFDYIANTLIYIPEKMPFPDNKSQAYITAIGEHIMRLIDATHGHTLILFTSYWVMELVYRRILKDIAQRFPVYIMNRGRVDMIEMFRNSINGVLFASDAAGEGIDLPGDVLSSLIIVRLPFAVPDAVTQREQEAYSSLYDYLANATIPNMLIKLKQYAGRAIRNESDTAVISILDNRVCQGGRYRETVLRALPPANVTNRITDVEAFIRNKKDDAYFIANSSMEDKHD